MAQHEHLPLYKQTFNLLVEFHKLIPNFPKKYKFELGSQIIKDLTNSKKLQKIKDLNVNYCIIK
jgi:hypothetical protein